MRQVISTSSAVLCLALSNVAFASPAVGSPTLVIAEFRTRGPNGANDEFIEVYNRSASPVAVDGWKLMRSPGSTSSGGPTPIIQFPVGTTIVNGGFLLLVNSGSHGYSGKVAPDFTYSGGVDDDGGIAIVDAGSAIVDQVGMNPATAFVEGTALDPMVANVNQSYERDNGGCYPDHDSDDNLADFRFNGSSSYAKNSTSNCTNCTDVVCQLPAGVQCWELSGACVTGACVYTQLPTGSACDDGDACTTGESCDASGICGTGSTVVCSAPPADYCSDANTLVAHHAGTCNPDLGCQYTPKAPEVCTWGCNSTSLSCNSYPCVETCSSPPDNGCYVATPGTCLSNGTCSYTYNPLGTSCEDGNLCTTGDTCNATGTCLSGSAVAIEDGNPCTVDSCDPTTGNVTHTPLSIGADCDDGNLCNGVATCRLQNSAIACVNGLDVQCDSPSVGGCYAPTGTCEPSTGICSYAYLSVGTTCDDANPCTLGDQCDGMGTCAGSTKPCADYHACTDSVHSRLFWSGSCASSDGTCSYSTTDTSCASGCDADSGLCKADPCLSMNCSAAPESCLVGVCSNGACSYQLKPEGSSCDDGNRCTSADQCSAAGACQGTPLICNSPATLHACVSSTTSRSWDVNGSCLAVSGLCNYTPWDTFCAHGCDADTGLCAADPCAGKSCDQPPDQCHQSNGSCSGGNCSYALKPVASACDDGNVCTTNDACNSSGTCQGTPVVCGEPPNPECLSGNTVSRTYAVLGTCNTLGVCTYPPTDKSCATGCDSATGLCIGDPCATVVCNQSPGACFADQGQCDETGTCSYPPKPAGVPCNDGNACTSGESCDGNGACRGSPSAGCGVAGSSGVGGGVAASGAPSVGGGVAASGAFGIGGTGVALSGAPGIGGSEAALGGATALTASTGPAASAGAPALSSDSGGSLNTTTSPNNVAGGSLKASGGSNATNQAGNATSNKTGGAVATSATAQARPAGSGTISTGNSTGGGGDSGCGCSIPSSTNRPVWIAALIGLLGLRRRRRS